MGDEAGMIWRQCLATLKLIGWLPVAGSALGVALLLALNATVWQGLDDALLPTARVVETVAPLAVGLHAAFLLSPEDEEPLELLLACPRPLSHILLRRLLTMTALQGSVALIGALTSHALGVNESIVLTTARWVAPSIFIGGAALCTTTATRKGTFSALIATILWGGMLLGSNVLLRRWPLLWPLHVYLQPASVSPILYPINRIVLTLTGVALTALAAYLTQDEERLLGVHSAKGAKNR